ncbi:uncharacterized protein DFE_0941 [Desulfovibrio ferrophilus]|uniref:Uncharacterized protein n=1 Tax=Desulfovibrio ferrophilus TaxID=241368 RepID=A0A2Z6AWN7_9BACT|nr:uncharacterized protein DFE_0941 [Desulfovibrio ferrophilus]
MLPTGFPRWLRLMNAGQNIRAKRVVFMEAIRSLRHAGPNAHKPTRESKCGLPSCSQIRQAMVRAQEIIKQYTRWESRIESIDVRLPSALNPGENSTLGARGRIIDKADAPQASFSSSRPPSASAPHHHAEGSSTTQQASQGSPLHPTAQSPQKGAAQGESAVTTVESGLGVVTNIKG